MGRTSLQQELVDLRRWYTRERISEAAPAISAALAGFTASDRRLLVDALRSHGRDPFATPLVVTHHEIAGARALLMPDAEDADQRALESSLLLAAAAAVRHLHWRPPGTLLRPAQVVAAVLPGRATRPGGIALALTGPDVLGPFLAEALPHRGDDGVSGTPGLRVRPHGDHLELQLLGTNATAVIRNVPAAVRAAAMAYLTDAFDDDRGRRLWDLSPDRITSAEHRHHAQAPVPPDLVGLGSGLLRRLPLLRHALFADAFFQARSWKIQWTGHLEAAAVAADLRHPVFGLPGTSTVRFANADAALLVNADGELSLRRETPVRPEHDLDLRRRVEGLEDAPWRTWLDSPTGRRLARTAARRADERAGYTQERRRAAAAGLGTDGSHGLDTCSDRQRKLRALLALHVFNGGRMGVEAPADTRVDTITRYTMILSPRHDDLVVVAEAPRNVAAYLVNSHPDDGLPGMRMVGRPGRSTFQMLHLPTGATLTITDESGHHSGIPAPDPESWWPGSRWCGTDVDVTDSERAALDGLPPVSPDAEQLLAALIVRICTADPNANWALGTWFSDPLPRPDPIGAPRDAGRRLWGEGDSWELRWSGLPYGIDVVSSLTDHAIGLPGTGLSRSGRDYTVTHGSCTLVARPQIDDPPRAHAGAYERPRQLPAGPYVAVGEERAGGRVVRA
ncbi:hypothetical protein [Pseudonocardia lacus]|uniref:hypothetical protein n=1 Tax=Pseudonocardia lacus TaxID=2835865 RepID=UPI001BDD4A1B|nr:hypothetical protein [Pseudonocardia lacus]